MSTLNSALAQYEKMKKALSGNTVSQEDRLKKYFTTVLPKGVKEKQKRIRILPTLDGQSPFQEVKFHELQVDGQWVKLYDPEQEKKRSPLNEVREELLSTGNESDKELAKTYRSKTFYIVKIIDRDNESDGVKFWRFKYKAKGLGVLDKIGPILINKGDIFDPETGRDLILTLTSEKSNNGKEYTNITSVMHDDPSPLSTDVAQSDLWLSDELTWSDVYSKKPEEYLDMVAKGETPRWSSTLGKYVSDIEETDSIGSESTNNETSKLVNETPDSVNVVNNAPIQEIDDDLPF
jgi:hypothetical protein